MIVLSMISDIIFTMCCVQKFTQSDLLENWEISILFILNKGKISEPIMIVATNGVSSRNDFIKYFIKKMIYRLGDYVITLYNHRIKSHNSVSFMLDCFHISI
uniref:Uncharacterized protein n=1 Tax=Onchocerca volvulus TaxID=6282 RepID=A0A8R1Y0V0_ONCVO